MHIAKNVRTDTFKFSKYIGIVPIKKIGYMWEVWRNTLKNNVSLNSGFFFTNNGSVSILFALLKIKFKMNKNEKVVSPIKNKRYFYNFKFNLNYGGNKNAKKQ